MSETLLFRLRRLATFLRHVPPRRLATRIRLAISRRLADRFGWRLPAKGPHPLRRDRRKPLMPPRAGMIARTEGGGIAAFTFLARTERVRLSDPGWRPLATDQPGQLWLMHLHYMEYLEEADDRLFSQLVDRWIAANDPPRPGAWRTAWNSYALSIRVVVWMQQLAVRHSRLDPSLRARAVSSLHRQLNFLARNLETDLGGNHLVKNAKALLFAGRFFERAETFFEQGERLLLCEFGRQILPDGVHAERSPSYHAQVLVDGLEMLHAGLSPRAEAELRPILSNMLGALVDIRHPDGGPALFNDAGLSMSYPPGDVIAAAERLGLSPPVPEEAIVHRPHAGYFGIRRRDVTLLADCGPIGPDDLPAHAHGDVLSFELSIAGRRFVVDQGVFEYVEGPRRRAARAAASHNTLSVAGRDQAEFFGAFRCGRRPRPVVRTFTQTPDGFVLEGHHDAYTRGLRPLVHHRRFELTGNALTVIDHLDGPGPAPCAKIALLLHPDVAIAEARTKCPIHTIELRQGGLRLFIESDAPISAEDAVWWPDPGIETPTHRLSAHPTRWPHRTRFIWSTTPC